MSSRHIRGPLVFRNTYEHTAAGDVTAAMLANMSVLLVNKASGAATAVALPVQSYVGQAIFVVDAKGDAWSNPITITPNTGTVNGSATYVISESYGSVMLIWDGTNFTTLAESVLNTLASTAAEIDRAADVSARVVNATASTLAVTEALHDGKTIALDRAAGIAVTLPVPVAGMRFRFVVKTTFTGAATIKSVAGTHIMIGHALMGNDTNTSVVEWQALASDTFDTINLFGTANSTGGIAGQIIEIEALSSTVWFVEIRGDAAGTEATPFENTVA